MAVPYYDEHVGGESSSSGQNIMYSALLLYMNGYGIPVQQETQYGNRSELCISFIQCRLYNFNCLRNSDQLDIPPVIRLKERKNLVTRREQNVHTINTTGRLV